MSFILVTRNHVMIHCIVYIVALCGVDFSDILVICVAHFRGISFYRASMNATVDAIRSYSTHGGKNNAPRIEVCYLNLSGKTTNDNGNRHDKNESVDTLK